jgi:hypothetical protein
MLEMIYADVMPNPLYTPETMTRRLVSSTHDMLSKEQSHA